jgi:integrase
MSQRIRTSKVGVFYRESISESGKTIKTYYYNFTSKAGKKIEKKVGSDANGFNVGKAEEARKTAIQLDALGSDSKFMKSDEIMSTTLDYVAEIHFDIKAKKNSNNIKDIQRYNNHIGFIEKYHQEFIEVAKKALKDSTTKGGTITATHRLKLLESKKKTSPIGSYQIADIGSAHIDKLMKQADEKELGAKSKDTILASLSAIFETAINKGYVGSNPVRTWRKNEDNINPKSEIDNESERYLSDSEIEALYKGVEDDCEATRLFVHLALKTGARANSVCNIKKKDIIGNTIRLTDEKRKLPKDRTYTNPIPSSLLELLQPRLDAIKPNDFIVDMDYQNINNKMTRIYKTLFNGDLDFREDRKIYVSNHTLRHTFASQLAIKKTPIFVIMKLMHHADIKMTIRYAKLNSEENGSEYVEMLK